MANPLDGAFITAMASRRRQSRIAGPSKRDAVLAGDSMAFIHRSLAYQNLTASLPTRSRHSN
jgi:hypothetical protein